jgi:hypothetical protein
MNTIGKDQNAQEYQRVLKARQQVYKPVNAASADVQTDYLVTARSLFS